MIFNWYSFALGLKRQLNAVICQFKGELNELDHSDSEEGLEDRLNEIMIYISTRFNPTTMNFRTGVMGYVTPEAAFNITAALANDTRSDVLSYLTNRTEELVQAKLDRLQESKRHQKLLAHNRTVAENLKKAKEAGKKRREAALQIKEPKIRPPPTKQPQDMKPEERKRYRALRDTAKKNISQMKQVGEKRVLQILDRSNRSGNFGSDTKSPRLPPLKLPTPGTGNLN